MNNMEARRAELEKKRQKLEQLRLERQKVKEEKDRALKLKTATVDDGPTSVDDILSSLGVSGINLNAAKGNTSHAIVTSGAIEPDALSSSSSVQGTPTRAPRKSSALQVVNVNQSNILPKECVMYSKTTQTMGGADRDDKYGGCSGKNIKANQPIDYYMLTHWDEEWDDEFQALTYGEEDGGSPPSFEAIQQNAQQLVSVQSSGAETTLCPRKTDIPEAIPTNYRVDARKVRLLNEEERHQIYISPEFQVFMDRSSRIMERALTEDVDIFTDYTGTGEENEAEDKSRMKLSKARLFYDELWCKNKLVTGFDWSLQFPELFAASYAPIDERQDSEGLVVVWNMKFKKETPEYVLRSQSGVMSTCFAKFHPNLIVGGLYSGQIVVWDNRSNKKTPVQRSPLSAQSHTHPVYSIQVVGTQNAHNLVSISTDGKFCSWSLDMLSHPQEMMDLNHAKQSKPAAATCMSFPNGEFNQYVIGSEEGTVYSACRHGSKAGVTDAYEGHQGPITGIQYNPTVGPVDFSHLYLTSSFDWTIKLWSIKEHKHIFSFENNSDYIYDVAWSPYNPAVFASVDGTGRLDLWNLINDAEMPTVSEYIDAPSTKDVPPALNRLIWSQTGHQVVVGDDGGRCHVYDVGDQLAMPKPDDWSKMVRTVQDLKNNQTEDDSPARTFN